MSLTPTAFVADADLRLDAQPTLSRPRARLAVAILAALLLEGGVFALVWFEREQPTIPLPEEIPVEIVVEPPPPPPEPEPQPELKQQQEYEKPATDAPREGKSDHDDEQVAEKEKPAAAPPPPPEPTPSPEATQPAAQEPAPELPKAEEAEAPPPVKAETPAPAPSPKPKPTQLASLPTTFENVPDLDFGGAAIKSPVTGGNAKSTYLSMLYGLIVPRLHVPPVAHAYGRRLKGAISFAVDGRGRLMHRFVAEGSGSVELDAAAMEAVSAASRSFPPPPKGAPIGMTFTYSVE
jgi:periplasmic protein TonB